MARRKDLTPKQARFVEEYLIDLNATQAAIRAGYAPGSAFVTGCRLLKHAKISAYLSEAQAKREQRTELSQDWVIRRLVENVERAMTAEPVFDRQGQPTGEYVYQGSVANKALELLGKHMGLFTDRLEMTGGGGAPVEISVVRQIVAAAKNRIAHVTTNGNGHKNGANGRAQH